MKKFENYLIKDFSLISIVTDICVDYYYANNGWYYIFQIEGHQYRVNYYEMYDIKEGVKTRSHKECETECIKSRDKLITLIEKANKKERKVKALIL
jgi:outer membrane protein assembly factor BamE (lipoprotein component of BamABCDE complex)